MKAMNKAMIMLWLALKMNVYYDLLTLIDFALDFGLIGKERRDSWFLAVSYKGLKAIDRCIELGKEIGRDTSRLEKDSNMVKNELEGFKFWRM